MPNEAATPDSVVDAVGLVFVQWLREHSFRQGDSHAVLGVDCRGVGGEGVREHL